MRPGGACKRSPRPPRRSKDSIRRQELERATEALAFAERQLDPFEPATRLRALISEARDRRPPTVVQAVDNGAIHLKLRRAQQLLTGGEFGAAIRLLRTALEANPESEEIEAMLTAAKEAQGRAAESERREQAVSEARTGVELHLAAGDTEAARQAVEFAIELLGPTSELVTLRKRVSQAELSETAVRSRTMSVRLPTVPREPSAHGQSTNEIDSLLAIARELERSGQATPARRTLEAALELDPGNPDALLLMARLGGTQAG